ADAGALARRAGQHRGGACRSRAPRERTAAQRGLGARTGCTVHCSGKGIPAGVTGASMSAFTGELFGTALLILLGDGVVANVLLRGTKGNGAGWIVITFGWAMAVFVGVVVAAAASGAHLNPAITLALALAGKFEWGEAPPYIVAQMLGACI